ncbi:MAG: DUF2252 family protein [Sphingomonas sp.]
MARSAHAFVRGNTAGFYDQLRHLPASKRPPAGPAIWIMRRLPSRQSRPADRW